MIGLETTAHVNERSRLQFHLLKSLMSDFLVKLNSLIVWSCVFIFYHLFPFLPENQKTFFKPTSTTGVSLFSAFKQQSNHHTFRNSKFSYVKCILITSCILRFKIFFFHHGILSYVHHNPGLKYLNMVSHVKLGKNIIAMQEIVLPLLH